LKGNVEDDIASQMQQLSQFSVQLVAQMVESWRIAIWRSATDASQIWLKTGGFRRFGFERTGDANSLGMFIAPSVGRKFPIQSGQPCP
jgi:hypothetical protein